jgi:hypothetical protein
MAQRKPAGKKSERKEQTAAQVALTSPYNTMIPLHEAAYVYVAHPSTRKLIHCSTSSVMFLDLMKELFDLGVGQRLLQEFAEFSASDPRWSEVADKVLAHVEGVSVEEPSDGFSDDRGADRAS